MKYFLVLLATASCVLNICGAEKLFAADAPRIAIPSGLEYSFTKIPFITPKIIQELSSWISDEGDQVVELDLSGPQGCNRYFGKIETETQEQGFPRVIVSEKKSKNDIKQPWFGYKFIGTSRSGIYVLQTFECEGGRDVFETALLLVFVQDHGMHVDEKNHLLTTGAARTLIKKIGEIPLGDRWDGALKVEGDTLFEGRVKYFLDEKMLAPEAGVQ